MDGADPGGAGHRARIPRTQRRAATAAYDRGGRNARGGLCRVGEGDQTDLRTGGGGVSADEPQFTGEPQAPGSSTSREPSEEELRAAYEAELSRLTSGD